LLRAVSDAKQQLESLAAEVHEFDDIADTLCEEDKEELLELERKHRSAE
jgi:hypothetical protein